MMTVFVVLMTLYALQTKSTPYTAAPHKPASRTTGIEHQMNRTTHEKCDTLTKPSG